MNICLGLTYECLCPIRDLTEILLCTEAWPCRCCSADGVQERFWGTGNNVPCGDCVWQQLCLPALLFGLLLLLLNTFCTHISVSPSPPPWGAARANPRTLASAGAAWSRLTAPTTGGSQPRRPPTRQQPPTRTAPPAAPSGPWPPSPNSLGASTLLTPSRHRSVLGHWLVSAAWSVCELWGGIGFQLPAVVMGSPATGGLCLGSGGRAVGRGTSEP